MGRDTSDEAYVLDLCDRVLGILGSASTASTGYWATLARTAEAALPDLGLTSDQVWGLTKTDKAWVAALNALTATRRDDLNTEPMRRTSLAVCAGTVGEHQRQRMARHRC
jgi:hypothetical protein